MVVEQALKQRVPRDHRRDPRHRGLDHRQQPHRLVVVRRAVVDGLEGQPGEQVALAAGHDPDTRHHVVDDLAAAAPEPRIDGREVVLHVDPLADDERRGHDPFENHAFGIVIGMVRVQEGPTLEVDAVGQVPAADDEGRVARQPPFGSDVGPVGGSPSHVPVGPVGRFPRGGTGQPPAPLEGLGRPGTLEVVRQRRQLLPVRGRNLVHVVELDAVRGRNVLGGEEPEVVGNRQAALAQHRTNLRLIAHRGEGPRIGIAVLAAARPAVQGAEVRIVVGHAAVAAQHDEAAVALGQPDGAEPAFDDVGLLRGREPARARTGGGLLGGRQARVVRMPPSTATRVATGGRNHPSTVCLTES